MGFLARRRFLALAALCLIGLVGCATDPSLVRPDGDGAEWTVLERDQVKRTAEIRDSLDEMRLAFRDVIILRMSNSEQKRVDVTSIGPTIVSKVKDGAPAARTTFGISEKREHLVLLTQDVPKFRAYHREIPMAELTEGKRFRFPVVQESGELLEHTFTVQQVIVR